MSKTFDELPLMERLAIEQALFSRLGEDVSTKNPDSLRSAADEAVVASYRAMGARSYDVAVNGQKVGTYSVRLSREKPREVTRRLKVSDAGALCACIEDNPELVGEYASLMAQNFAEWVLETEGVLLDGCEVVEDVTPAKAPQVLGTTLRIDAGKVGAALAGYLPTTVAGLLGGGDDGE